MWAEGGGAQPGGHHHHNQGRTNAHSGRTSLAWGPASYGVGAEEAEDFWWRAYVEAQRRDLGTAVRTVIVLCDGVRWIWLRAGGAVWGTAPAAPRSAARPKPRQLSVRLSCPALRRERFCGGPPAATGWWGGRRAWYAVTH